MKTYTYLPLILLIVALTACSSAETYNAEYTTRITDMIEADVFDVLPSYEGEVLIYNDVLEIEGEYLELASVELTARSITQNESELMKRLINEARDLGSNGILITETTSSSEDGMLERNYKAVAVYALDLSPSLTPMASL